MSVHETVETVISCIANTCNEAISSNCIRCPCK